MKIQELKTPCYVIDEKKLRENLEILAGVQQRTGCKILLAQKAFSCFHEYPLIGKYLKGTTASGLFEARLGREEMNLENHVFSPAYREEEMDEIAGLCDHIVFNSFGQLEKYAPRLKGKSIGLRINPECSTQEDHAIYDPCAPGSRLGVTAEKFRENAEHSPQLLEALDGLHFHTLCEQNSDDLERTLAAVEEKFGQWLPRMKWLNMGGGHHITRDDYDMARLEQAISHVQTAWDLQVYLEPGEAVALNAGYLVSRVLDVVENSGIHVAILDASAACHMPDVLEMPYQPPVYQASKDSSQGLPFRLAGPTCLAGDVIGDYAFPAPLEEGDLLVFGDMAIYTTCKNNTFNGMPLPDIWRMDEHGVFTKLTDFGYQDFKMRLGK